jgi:DNA-binding LacI/PurR family transcriptional regulator
VFVDAPLDDEGPFVGTDNHQTIPLITDYLCRSGDHPTYFDTPKVNNNALDRRNAYIAAMERSNLEPRFAPLAPSKSFDFEKTAFEAAGQILRDRAFPTRTVLCANDRVAFGVLAAMCQAGMKVGFGPDCDFRVAGHDNQRLSAYTCPPLTTVSQDCEEMGRVAFRMLLAGIEGEALTKRNGESTRILLSGELVLRKSA